MRRHLPSFNYYDYVDKWQIRSRKLRLTTVGDRRADHATPLYGQVGTKFPRQVAVDQSV
jgi:hypothetical protein